MNDCLFIKNPDLVKNSNDDDDDFEEEDNEEDNKKLNVLKES